MLLSSMLKPVQLRIHGFEGKLLTALSRAGLRCADDARRAMRQTTTGRILLMMLAAGLNRAVEPIDLEILGGSPRVDPAINYMIAVENGDRNSR